MHLAAESIPVAEKRGAVNASIALKMSLYYIMQYILALVVKMMLIFPVLLSLQNLKPFLTHSPHLA
jgi:hypothetical protein